MTSCLAFMTSCLAFMTSCFASASCCMCFASLSCFDDVVLLRSLFFRRRTSCFASTTRSAFRSRSGLLCAIRHAKYAASVSKFPCCVCPCLCSPSASLPWRRRSLAFPFAVPFSQEDHAEQDSDCIHSMCLLLLAFGGAASPATEKNCALRAALCSPCYK